MHFDSPADAPWIRHPAADVCPACGDEAHYMTLGHMYRKHCGGCGWEEYGTFSPPVEAGPPVALPDAFIQMDGARASAKNLFDLARLHPSLSGLRPGELKTIVERGGLYPLGELYPEELSKVRLRAERTVYRIVVRQQR
jgi:ribosomal protein S27AE